MTLTFQLNHYQQLFDATPKFIVNESGEIQINPARHFRRVFLYQLKKQINDTGTNNRR